VIDSNSDEAQQIKEKLRKALGGEGPRPNLGIRARLARTKALPNATTRPWTAHGATDRSVISAPSDPLVGDGGSEIEAGIHKSPPNVTDAVRSPWGVTVAKSIKRLLSALLAGVVMCAGLAMVGAPALAGTVLPGTDCPMFPADNVWNTDISTLPVDPHSATWLPAWRAQPPTCIQTSARPMILPSPTAFPTQWFRRRTHW